VISGQFRLHVISVRRLLHSATSLPAAMQRLIGLCAAITIMLSLNGAARAHQNDIAKFDEKLY